MCVVVWKETALLVFFKGNSAEQRASAESYLHAATQQNLCILLKMIVHYRAHNSQLLGRSLRKFICGIKSISECAKPGVPQRNLTRVYIF
jgi:hypothetical protein